MDIHSVDKKSCIGDWLEYTTPGEIWGRGFRMCNATRLNTTYLIGNSLELHFRADTMYESRGFWIKYEGNFHQIMIINTLHLTSTNVHHILDI